MAKCADVVFGSEDLAWSFCPSFPAAVLFAAIFFILTLVHLFQAYTFRKKFCWVIIMGTAWETAGFALRAASGQMVDDLGLYIAHRNFIILAPLWLNAFVYMVLARMVHYYLPEKACFGVTARKFSFMFVTFDIIAFIVQGSATGLMVSDNPQEASVGFKVYMGGVGLQQLFISAFICIAVRFHHKLRTIENPRSASWAPLLRTEYVALLFITIRNIYRIIEFSQGYEGNIAKAEAAFYVLDAAPMAIATFLFNVFHPGRTLVGPDSEFPKKDKKRRKGKKTERYMMSRKSEGNESSDQSQV